ncbi:MAG: RdgB/HAM1 family non-canonical purine NTP pyrophosphatase [Phycisphaerae bacterium]
MSPPRPILVATHNPGKVREIAALLDAEDPALRERVRWVSLDDLPDPIPAPHEDQPTFAANAALKARYYSRASGLWTLADDSGLEVDALHGAPGVLSARFAPLDAAAASTGRAAQDDANNRKLIAALRGVPPERRTARFRCCLALANGETLLATATGAIDGLIIDSPRGAGGFGYDPHFLVPGLGRTTAELPLAEKNRVSHRGQALRRLRPVLLAALDGRPAAPARR